MYLNTKLEEFDGNINVAFIGCGKFISMFLSQYNHLKKIKIDTIIDLKIDQAKKPFNLAHSICSSISDG